MCLDEVLGSEFPIRNEIIRDIINTQLRAIIPQYTGIVQMKLLDFVADDLFNVKSPQSAKCGHKLIDKINSLGINECLLN